jgi:hypothetical protein
MLGYRFDLPPFAFPNTRTMRKTNAGAGSYRKITASAPTANDIDPTFTFICYVVRRSIDSVRCLRLADNLSHQAINWPLKEFVQQATVLLLLAETWVRTALHDDRHIANGE